MKTFKFALAIALVLGLGFSVSFAAKHTAEERGMTLFNDPKAFGGMKACAECHPNGRGLEKSGGKMTFSLGGKSQKSLEEAVNFCIVNANKGKAIGAKSKEMMDIVAYIKSLGMKGTPGY